MKISKRVGRMALKRVGVNWKKTLPMELEDMEYEMGSCSGDADTYDYKSQHDANAHFDTLMCLIASIAGADKNGRL